MRNKKVHVEIVAPVHNRKAITLQCLRSLSRIDRTGLEVHVIVVDDGSTDGTGEAVREGYPETQIIQGDGSLWYTAGTNRGIQAALLKRPDYILAINDDSIFHDQFLRRLIRCAENNSRSVIGALLLLWDQPHKVFQVGALWDSWYGGWKFPSQMTVRTVPRTPWKVEGIVGNCVLYPVEAVKQAGFMNEKASPHYGDIEYTTRMRKAGWNLLIEPSAYVWCQPNSIPASLRSLPKRELFLEMFRNRRSQRNLTHMFKIRWYSAPSKWLGMVSFGIMMIRLGLKWAGLGGAWPNETGAGDASSAGETDRNGKFN